MTIPDTAVDVLRLLLDEYFLSDPHAMVYRTYGGLQLLIPEKPTRLDVLFEHLVYEVLRLRGLDHWVVRPHYRGVYIIESTR